MESEQPKNAQLRRWFDLSYLRSAVRSRRRSFRTLRFAVYPVLHANFASVFRKLPFRSFAFRVSQITHSLPCTRISGSWWCPITHRLNTRTSSRSCAVDQTAIRPLLTALRLLQCADSPPCPQWRDEHRRRCRRLVCLLQEAVTDARSTNSATSLAGCNHAMLCSNRQSFKLCFQTDVFY